MPGGVLIFTIEEGPNEVGRSPDDLPKGPGLPGGALMIYHEEGPNEVGKSPDGFS